MKRIAIGLIAAGFLAVSSAALAVDGGSGGAVTSAHNATNAKGTCAKCHIPHGGKGDKIWAQTITSRTDFAGVHQLCNSCHYAGNSFSATSGISGAAANVFVLNAYQNHSMLQWANTGGPGIAIPLGFPLNTSDTDTLWTAVADPDTGAGNNTNYGFYCGTCHNPHKQPLLPTAITNGNGDYLRNDPLITTITAFGNSGARDGACTQCHTAAFIAGNAAGHEGNCSQCHSPHKGRTLASANAMIAEKILTIPLIAANVFTATPNVDDCSGDLYTATISTVCFGCHKGIAPLGGLPDLDTVIRTTDEHHPMCSDASLASPSHAPGWQAGAAGTFGCSTCHEIHNGTQDYYLRPTTGTYTGSATDDGVYCTTFCHTDKSVAALGEALDTNGHYWGLGAAFTGNRATCFMCHSIHDGTSRGIAPRADINALMRVSPVNFAAAERNADTDVNDYEDMCYGCHSAATITGGTGLGGATLAENGVTAFTHKFTAAPSVDVATRMTAANLPVAAATMTGGEEYGAVAGNLYCGTCHNVHVQLTADAQGQMFRKFNNQGASLAVLCVDCHSASGMTSGRSHPTYLDAGYNTDIPNARTEASIPAQFGSGGDGVPGGRTGASTPGQVTPATGQMSCETCHNFHTASTSLLGNINDTAAANKGKLLVMDNNEAGAGSEMCLGCHGTAY